MRRAGFLTKAIMVILIVVFSATLVYTVYSYRVEQREKMKTLKSDSDQVKQEEKIEEEKKEPEEEQEEEQKEEQKEENEEQKVAEDDAVASLPILISCRGESWAPDGNNKEDGWPSKLENLMTDHEINATVSDYTLDMAGTLSQMRFAGVSEETVNAYIEKHIEDDLSGDNETSVISQLENYEAERDDYEAIPVICIGYNGGYGDSSAELIEQQGEILATYTLQEAGQNKNEDTGDKEVVSYDDGNMGISGKYLIVGHLPSSWRNLNNYENRMKEAWGDHYVSLNGIEEDEDVLSDSFRTSVAKTVYDKMVEMGYLEQ